MSTNRAMTSADHIKRKMCAEIVRQYAKTRYGEVETCKPAWRERDGVEHRHASPGTDGKVVYPTLQAAQIAAELLRRVGSKPMNTYECTRTYTGVHYHLASRRVESANG